MKLIYSSECVNAHSTVQETLKRDLMQSNEHRSFIGFWTINNFHINASDCSVNKDVFVKIMPYRWYPIHKWQHVVNFWLGNWSRASVQLFQLNLADIHLSTTFLQAYHLPLLWFLVCVFYFNALWMFWCHTNLTYVSEIKLFFVHCHISLSHCR